jgi:hypothetical protein
MEKILKELQGIIDTGILPNGDHVDVASKIYIEELYAKLSLVMDAPVIGDWTKEKPNKPCVFITRNWDKDLEIYNYGFWKLMTTDGGSLRPPYLGWYTESGDEWDEHNICSFNDEYKIIGEV